MSFRKSCALVCEGLFKYGFQFTGLSASINRFDNGNFKFEITGPSIISTATGHWPYHTFHLVAVTGHLAGWQASIMGLTFGSQLIRNVDKDGQLLGPDYRKFYWFFMALNHRDKMLIEIINPDKERN